MSESSPTGYATDGGFPFQISALSELFDQTTLVVPCSTETKGNGLFELKGHHLSVVPLSNPTGRGVWRKINLLFWLMRHWGPIIRELRRADAVHVPIPSDLGSIGMLLAFAMRKRLFVRHCGNWFAPRTAAERFWKWFMERYAGGRNVMLATGGATTAPSKFNREVQWIFSTSLTERELTEFGTARLKPPLDRIALITVSRQEQGKGTDVVISSMPEIIRLFPQATLHVVGDGSALGKYKELAATLGIGPRVVFHGRVNHEKVMELCRQADLFCYPTTASEGFPKVVLEALATGLPVITTRVSVLPHLIGAGGGVLLDAASPEAVAQAVSRVLREEQSYRTMSAQAVLSARQYSLERWRRVIGDLLRSRWGQLQRAGHVV